MEDSGDCETELPGGSVLLSVNGLSARGGLPSNITSDNSQSESSPLFAVQQFVNDFPIAMTAAVQVLTYPTAHFILSVSIPSTPSEGGGESPENWMENTAVYISNGHFFVMATDKNINLKYPVGSCSVEITGISLVSKDFTAEIRDVRTGKTHFAVKCDSQSEREKFFSLLRILRAAISLHTQSWSHLSILQSLNEDIIRKKKKRNSFISETTRNIQNNSSISDLSFQAPLSQSKERKIESKIDEDNNNHSRNNIYRAVELLEETLDRMELPPVLPSVDSVEHILQEIATLHARSRKFLAECIVFEVFASSISVNNHLLKMNFPLCRVEICPMLWNRKYVISFMLH